MTTAHGGAGPRLVGVGVGPGDPELLTVKAVRVFREAAVVFVPIGDAGETGRAEAVVRAHIGQDKVRQLTFALSDDPAARAANWERAGAAVVAALRQHGGMVAFATIGDPSVYSTFAYLAATVRELAPGTAIETVPGITAMQDLAARAGVSLVEGDEQLALLPLAAGADALAAALARFDTVVCYKGGRHLPGILEALQQRGRLERAIYGARLGLEGEVVLPAAALGGRPGPYLSTVIALPERAGPGRPGRPGR